MRFWALFLLFFSAAGISQTYPAKPLRLIVPFPPGGSKDIVGRMAAYKLGDRLGQ